MGVRTSIAMKRNTKNVSRGGSRTAPKVRTAPKDRQSPPHPPEYLCLEDVCPGGDARCAGSEEHSRSCAWGLVVSYRRPLLLLLWAPPGAPFRSRGPYAP